MYKDDSNYGAGGMGPSVAEDSFKGTNMSETQKQMEGIDEFDTQKFKEKLHAISSNFNRFN